MKDDLIGTLALRHQISRAKLGRGSLRDSGEVWKRFGKGLGDVQRGSGEVEKGGNRTIRETTYRKKGERKVDARSRQRLLAT